MKRDIRIGIRLSAQEHQVLNSLAQLEGVSVSEAARQLIHENCKQAGFFVGMVAAPETHKEPEAQK